MKEKENSSELKSELKSHIIIKYLLF
jgi:hypothetical protein